MSSARLTFSVEQLEKAAAEKRDQRIKNARDEFKNRKSVRQARDEWRAEAEAAIKEMARGLDKRADAELSGFYIKDAPTRGGRYSKRAESERDEAIARAEDSYTWTMRRIVSLGAVHKDGLDLTPTMLKEFFSL